MKTRSPAPPASPNSYTPWSLVLAALLGLPGCGLDDGRSLAMGPEDRGSECDSDMPPSCYPGDLECGDVQWSPDTNARPDREGAAIDTVVIHKLQGSLTGGETEFLNADNGASIHFIVGHQGEIVCMVPPEEGASHAGSGEYNRRSIGIELEGEDARSDTTGAQLDALATLLRGLTLDHPSLLPDRDHIIGHIEVPKPPGSEIPVGCGGASGKPDPGILFPWDDLMARLGAEDVELSEEEIAWEVVSIDAPDSLAVDETASITVTLRNRGTAAWEYEWLRLHAIDGDELSTSQFALEWGDEFSDYWSNGLVFPQVSNPIEGVGPEGCYGPLREAVLQFPIEAPSQTGCAEEAPCVHRLRFGAWAVTRTTGAGGSYFDDTYFDLEIEVTPR